MIAYGIGTALSCALAAWMQRKDTRTPGGVSAKRRWFEIVCCAIPLWLLSALRWGVGTDFFYTYLPEFRALQWLRSGGEETLCRELFAPLEELLALWGLPSAPEEALPFFLGVLSNCEAGYRALMEAAIALGGNFRLVIIATSSIINVCVFYAIFTQTSDPTLAIYLYVTTSNYFLGMNIIRQYVAVGIGLAALRFVREQKLLPFLVCVAAAALFHTTALLLLPCYFLCRVRWKPYQGQLLLATVLAGSGLLGTAAAWLLPRIGLAYYARYLGTAWDTGRFEMLFFLIDLGILLLGGVYWEKASRKNAYYGIWYNMLLLGALALALSGELPLMKRVSYYYTAPQFLLLPEALNAEEDPVRRKWLKIAVAVFFGMEVLIAVGVFNKNGVLPYRIR